MNTITTGEQQEKEIERIIASLDFEDRVHLRAVVYDIVRCYEPKSGVGAVVIFGTKKGTEGVLMVNCDGMQAAQMLLDANDFLAYLNSKDAPPKEMFN